MFLLPTPQTCTFYKDCFLIAQECPIVIDASLPVQAFTTASILQQEVYADLGYTLPIQKSACRGEIPSIFLTLQADIPGEGYTLCVTPANIVICGADIAGLLHGVSTLRQIIRQAGAYIPCLQINDEPSIPARGYYFDTSRGRIPTLDSLKKLADTLCLYKMNQLQLYIEHSYLFQNLSEVWRDDTPLTAEDILELDRYCQERCIELVPSLASFGHLYKLLCTKSFQNLCELEGSSEESFSFDSRMAHHTVNVSNPQSLAFIKQMISEYMQLFSSRLFNICADETFDLGKGRSRALAREKGTTTLYTDYVRELADYLISLGRTPMFWSDVICEEPDALNTLPPELICLHWDYAPDVSKERFKKLLAAGARQLYLCPGVHGWNRLLNQQHLAYENISRLADLAHHNPVCGFLTTDWGDFGHINHPAFSIPGLIYGASLSWSSMPQEEDELNVAISAIEYRDNTGTIASVFRSLGEQDAFPWYYAVRIIESLSIDKNSKKASDFLSYCSPDRTEADNKHLADLIQQLYQVLPGAASDTKAVINAYIIAAEGQQLLNVILPVVVKKLQGSTIQRPDLASRLEIWLMHYHKLWLTVSRESEFYRLAHIFYKYADYLRG